MSVCAVSAKYMPEKGGGGGGVGTSVGKGRSVSVFDAPGVPLDGVVAFGVGDGVGTSVGEGVGVGGGRVGAPGEGK